MENNSDICIKSKHINIYFEKENHSKIISQFSFEINKYSRKKLKKRVNVYLTYNR